MLPLLTVLALMGAYIGENQVLCDPEEVLLTMAPDSYDDQYRKCPSAMEHNLMDPTTDGFQKKYDLVWKNATNRWNQIKGSLQLPRSFKEEYGIALIAYTASSNLSKDFNTAVQTGGQSTEYYKQSFKFKSFHFLLTKAIQALKTSQTGCYNVYRGTRNKRFIVPCRNKTVRFGHFSSSSLSENAAKDFGEDTFFTIKTCLGANISGFSYFSVQEEVLIPPYEMFRVEENNKNDKSKINLRSVSNSSSFNCECKRGPSSLAPGIPTSFLLWGFLLFSGALHSMGSL